MEQLILIVSLVSKQLFMFPLVSYGIFFIVAVALIRVLLNGKLDNPFYSISLRGYIFVGVLFLFQYFALLIAAEEIGQNLNRQFFKLVLLFIVSAGYYFAVRQLMITDQSVENFTMSFFWGFVILEIICLLQIAYIYTSKFLEPILFYIGSRFEVQDAWTPELYTRGSFTVSNLRVNGLSREPGFLAAMLAICFAPFILAAIKNKVNIFFRNKVYFGSLYYLALIILILTLLLAKTSTGLIAIILILILPVFLSKTKTSLKWLMMTIPLIVLGWGLYTFVPTINTMLNHYIFDKGSTVSLPMRLGAFSAMKTTVIKHPFFGVGYENTSFYNLLYFPGEYRNVSEYKQHVMMNYFSDLSSLGGLIAQFGIVISTVVFVYFIKLIKDIKKYANMTKDTYYIALADSSLFFFSLLVIIGILSIDISQPIYFVSIFYFIGLRKFLWRKSEVIK